MSKQDENSMIGYDPLAWMHEVEDKKQADTSLEREEIHAADTWVELDDEPEIEEEQNGRVESNGPDSDAWYSNMASLNETDGKNKAATRQTEAIVLNSVQTIQTVCQLHAQLLQALDSRNTLNLDASAVTRIDTATLQLLVVLKQTAMRQRKAVLIDFPSENFLEAAKLLGLAEVLHVD